MADAVAELERSPEPGQPASRTPARANGNRPAPDGKADESRVGDEEAHSEIGADEAADEASWGEHLVESRDVLLDRVRCLRENKKEECELASAFHKTSSSRLTDRGSAAAAREPP